MTTMTIRIPDDVKAAFDKAFEGIRKGMPAISQAEIRPLREEGRH